MFVFNTILSIALFYNPSSPNTFIPSHTTVCPSVKYYSRYEDIINPVNKSPPEVSFIKARKADAKRKRKEKDIEKHMSRVLVEKNKETAYITKIFNDRDGTDEPSKYSKYIHTIISFYTHKYVSVYKAYLQNSKNIQKVDVTTLTDLLISDGTIMLLKNKDYAFVIQYISQIIEDFDILNESIDYGIYESLPSEDIAKLKSAYIQYSKKPKRQ